MLLIYHYTMNTIAGFFNNVKDAKNAITVLKEHGYGEQISLVINDAEAAVEASSSKDITEGITTGAVSGATIGALAGALTGVSSLLIPGGALFVLGPIASTLAGLVSGGLAGGIIGGLVDLGIPEDKAREYEMRINSGEILVLITAEEERSDEVIDTLQNFHAAETQVMYV
jgi:uncharacterized membrane protein